MRNGGVLVIGDGPAGCAAAIAAARAGGAVTMVGAGRMRAVPECASAGALRLLDAISPAFATRSHIWLDHAWPDATVITQRARAVDRAQLDRGLREAAVRAGADYQVMPASTLRPRVAGDRVTGVEGMSGGGLAAGAYVVIDASGVNGWLRRTLGLPEGIDSGAWWLQRGFGVLAGGQASAPGTQFVIGANGWLWRYATPQGCIWTALCSTRDASVAWPPGMRPVGRIWRECRRWRHLRQAAGAGYFVCGDAAGYLDPATGDGLRFALESGARAGALAAGVVRWPQRSSLAAALYADWVLQTYLTSRAALREVYARAHLAVR
ncbi:Dehydrogenase (flavoprotein) [Ralstonia sp. 25mfcol4.1]|uniref:NAD(P)/FAD-dependent oxidoreductase n=1 Tax=Burkholderiaceae TaxID=119060 RepID=UPI00088C80EF|nr:FAD-dependent oxidoreductase [Ralstonia sp. 25mfcol4.1]SDP23452.1 Dehydrogenase (flavoprotein) [Ralstonia sp. 25mfcol4.1]